MFRLGSRSKSPRRVASALYGGHANQGGISNTGNPSSPTTIFATAQDSLHQQTSFLPWGSADSSSPTSPRVITSSAREQQKGGAVFHPTSHHNNNSSTSSCSNGNRSHSPTASVSTSTTGTTSSSMAKSSRNLLSRGRKQTSNLTEEFDPTTFRKNRSRPALGARGQDAVYQEYDDLFEEEDEDEDEDEDRETHELYDDERGDDDEDGGEASSHTDVDGNDDDGFFLLHMDEKPEPGKSAVTTTTAAAAAFNASLPKSRRQTPTESFSAFPPPTPPPKSWQRSIVTTTPPRSTAPSVEEFTELSAPVMAPPTPPPKPAPLSIETNFNNQSEITMGSNANGTVSPGAPHRPPPPAPGLKGKHFVRRLSAAGVKRTRSSDEGLGIITIPSPTLFSGGFSPGASGDWSDLSAGHLNALQKEPALTGMLDQAAGEGTPENPAMINVLYDETHSDTGPADAFALDFSSINSSSAGLDYFDGIEAGTIKVKLEQEIEHKSETGKGKMPATTENSVEALLDLLSKKDRKDSTKPDFDDMKMGAESRSGSEAGFMPVAQGSAGATRSTQGNSSKEEITTEDGKPDPAYLRAFRSFIKSSAANDAFVCRGPRFDAIQTNRICSQVVRPTAKTRQPSESITRPHTNSKARLREAGEEIMTGLWALMAGQWLNFGKIILSPAHEQLLAASTKQLTRRATLKYDNRAAQMLAEAERRKAPEPPVSPGEKERRRVLNLGGMAVADWGWHCAVDYPKAKVYTVSQRSRGPSGSASPSSPEDSSASAALPHFRGPKNHRHLSVERLYRLPFPNNHFDVVSARSLFLILKISVPTHSPNQQALDEYDRCLEECLRVLKPGGYLEFMLFDSDVINAGPLATALFDRFSEQLINTGRDPEPTKRWISRLYAAGYTDIKRAWTFLPMAPPASKPRVPTKDNPPGQDTQDVDVITEQVRRRMHAWEDAGVKGSINDVAAVAGLLTIWVWERWLRNAGIIEEEMVGNIVEEAKERGSGLRNLVGYARKPLTRA